MFQCETSLLLKCDGNVRIPFRQSRGIDLDLKKRRSVGSD